MPLQNGNPTAAELDRALKGQEAYDAAIAEGKSEADAIALAAERMAAHATTQRLRSLGVNLDA